LYLKDTIKLAKLKKLTLTRVDLCYSKTKKDIESGDWNLNT